MCIGLAHTLLKLLPAIHDQLADLRATIAADTAAKIRASEQNLLETLANHRRETDGTITGLSSELRRNLREVRQTVTELQEARNPLLSTQELRAELMRIIRENQAEHEAYMQSWTGRFDRHCAQTQAQIDRLRDPTETGARPRTEARPTAEGRSTAGAPNLT